MKPTESVLPPGIKPMSSYVHGTQFVSDENRINRKTRPKVQKAKSDRRGESSDKFEGEKKHLALMDNQLGL